MDQMMFDISEVKDPKVSDVITLINNELPISSWAKILNTISYELVCRLKMRLPRVYTRD
jgi:alanine racemase